MIWLTWRQFRPQAIAAAGALIVLAILLAATSHSVGSAYTSSGLAACHAHCAAIVSSFLSDLSPLDRFLFLGSVLLVYLAPALMGLFWGAPLIAREFETGTHRIAWNQSVTRTRWTLAKLGLVGLAAVATAGLLSLMVTWWASAIDHATSFLPGQGHVAVGGVGLGFGLTRLEPLLFGARGVAPLGYAAFAFALGVTAGVLLRRTLPAMAVTLAVFAVIQVVVPNVDPAAPAPADSYLGAAEPADRVPQPQLEPSHRPGERDPAHRVFRNTGRLGPVGRHRHAIGRAVHGATKGMPDRA